MIDIAEAIRINGISEKDLYVLYNILKSKGYRKPIEMPYDKDYLIFYSFSKKSELIKSNKLYKTMNGCLWFDYPKYGTGGPYKIENFYNALDFIKDSFINKMNKNRNKNRKIKFYI